LIGRAILEIVRMRDPQLGAGMIIDPASQSSYTIVLSTPGHDRSFLHFEGANASLAAADIDHALHSANLHHATLFHFGYPPLMPAIYADGGVAFAELLQQMKGAGIATSLDTAHVDADSPAGQVDWRAFLMRTLPHVDFFLPSLDEIIFMLDRARHHALVAEAHGRMLAETGGVALLQEVATTLLEMGAAVVAIKLGAHGLYLQSSNDPVRLAQAGSLCLAPAWQGRALLAPAFAVEVVGTTGAGDCAIAGLLAGMLRGLDPIATLRVAAAVGACNVEVADAISGVPTWEGLQIRLAEGWPQRINVLPMADWHFNEVTAVWHAPHDADAPHT
jgi:sugar/nucleoside kinase (ribokinase family)